MSDKGKKRKRKRDISPIEWDRVSEATGQQGGVSLSYWFYVCLKLTCDPFSFTLCNMLPFIAADGENSGKTMEQGEIEDSTSPAIRRGKNNYYEYIIAYWGNVYMDQSFSYFYKINLILLNE